MLCYYSFRFIIAAEVMLPRGAFVRQWCTLYVRYTKWRLLPRAWKEDCPLLVLVWVSPDASGGRVTLSLLSSSFIRDVYLTKMSTLQGLEFFVVQHRSPGTEGSQYIFVEWKECGVTLHMLECTHVHISECLCEGSQHKEGGSLRVDIMYFASFVPQHLHLAVPDSIIADWLTSWLQFRTQNTILKKLRMTKKLKFNKIK